MRLLKRNARAIRNGLKTEAWQPFEVPKAIGK